SGFTSQVIRLQVTNPLVWNLAGGSSLLFQQEVQGYFLHFRQALIKNLKSKNELLNKYLNDGKGKYRFAITQFSALDFEQPEHTGISFEVFLEDAYIMKHSTIFKGYLDYFERQWVGKKVTSQRSKSGAIAPWNCQSACIKWEMKSHIQPVSVAQAPEGEAWVKPQ
ncbi:hypothetical protein DSO57_1025281, partial [Entomophthora muscae]